MKPFFLAVWTCESSFVQFFLLSIHTVLIYTMYLYLDIIRIPICLSLLCTVLLLQRKCEQYLSGDV